MTDLKTKLGEEMFYQSHPTLRGHRQLWLLSSQKLNYERMASLALSSLTVILREPTQSMLDAGFEAHRHIGSDDTCKAIWSAMTAALAREQFSTVKQLERV